MKAIKHEMKNMSNCWFLESGIKIVLMNMSTYFLIIASHTQEIEKVGSWAYLLKNYGNTRFS